LQKEKQINISDLLEDGPLGSRAPLESARSKTAAMYLVPPAKERIQVAGETLLARAAPSKVFGRSRSAEVLLLRAREGPPAKEIKTWSNANFEEIVDVEPATLMWRSPYPTPRNSMQRKPVDPFCFLAGRFVHYLLTSILLHARLPTGRLYNSASENSLYNAIFDNASLGDVYLAPATNMGFSSPSLDRGWYPVSWRVTQVAEAASTESTPSHRCHGLVCGHWTAEEDDLTDVILT
jgi:hypothetical protein